MFFVADLTLLDVDEDLLCFHSNKLYCLDACSRLFSDIFTAYLPRAFYFFLPPQEPSMWTSAADLTSHT